MALKVLSALDSARTQYYHFQAIVIAGMGLFTDAYDLFCLPPVMILIGKRYYGHQTDDQSNYHGTPALIASAMVGVPLLGTVVGQIVFGLLGDRIGRRRVYGISLVLMVVSSIGSGFSICTSKACVISSLGFFRFWLGVGIGGDYPISATIMSEFANKKTRGGFVAGVFSMQGFGILASSAVAMVVCSIFNKVSHNEKDVDVAWRIIMMLGAIPAGLTFYWRMRMPETARYTALVERNARQAAKDMEKILGTPMRMITEEYEISSNVVTPYPLVSTEFFRRHGRHLLATAASWFLVDVVFYSSNLFQAQIYEYYLPQKKRNAYAEAFNVALFQALLSICSTIPGYWATVLLIDRIGRVKIQMTGFFFMAAALFAIGIPYYSYWDNMQVTSGKKAGFMILYALTFFWANFGPNSITFIVPAELFPARFRTTCHGLSGAAGKVGAIVGSVGFLWASHNKKGDGYPKGIGMEYSLVALGVICLVGMAVTYFLTPETMGRSLEENENEEEISGDDGCFVSCGLPSWSESVGTGGVKTIKSSAEVELVDASNQP